MAIIKQLSEKMANMIAAGEVVDRPASVIKELVENSIDAKANIIKIEVNDFGLSLIRVTDNGIGMEKEDAILAFYRHATSKISDEGDLSHINSLGFRGEALPSISSVSKVLLQTKVAGKEGVEIYLEGSKKIKEGITSMNEGTIISVMELFYNTPARFKYIKSDNAEKNAIIDTFNVLAMSYPNISFKLFMDNVLIKETYGNSDMGNLLSSIYGKEIA
ncbi:DNA mismatch repair endonuclease MutL, partial [Acholeplasma sp. OttesenSCG-928-E16]|nr:DNA mismatch repair endonuclease MutL [Acholeplasma sp. OttesenSCG-928-E16]